VGSAAVGGVCAGPCFLGPVDSLEQCVEIMAFDDREEAPEAVPEPVEIRLG